MRPSLGQEGGSTRWSADWKGSCPTRLSEESPTKNLEGGLAWLVGDGPTRPGSSLPLRMTKIKRPVEPAEVVNSSVRTLEPDGLRHGLQMEVRVAEGELGGLGPAGVELHVVLFSKPDGPVALVA